MTSQSTAHNHQHQPAPQPDDLTQVFGIGATTRDRLHEIGITTFRQLATADLATIRNAVKTQPSAIKRWQEIAATY